MPGGVRLARIAAIAGLLTVCTNERGNDHSEVHTTPAFEIAGTAGATSAPAYTDLQGAHTKAAGAVNASWKVRNGANPKFCTNRQLGAACASAAKRPGQGATRAT